MENPVIVTLAGKTAIVPGAASGIGLAVVLKYLDADADGVAAMNTNFKAMYWAARHVIPGDDSSLQDWE
jgi:NAD(P)-dependent dehydrogenase (short-subunit alcohol dehydrogenase family)